MTNGKLKRFLAFLLSFTMILSMNSMSVLAEELNSETENAIVYTVDAETGETPATQENETQVQESQTNAETGAKETVKETATAAESKKETTKETETETEETETETETKDEAAVIDANLNDFVTGIQIDGPGIVKEGNKYTVKAGYNYDIKVSFKETNAVQFVNDGSMMYYTLPFQLKDSHIYANTFDMTVSYGGVTYPVSGNSYTLEGDQIKVKWNTEDPNFQYLVKATNASFDLNFSAQFTKSDNPINWGKDITTEVDFDENQSISKTTDGKIYYAEDGLPYYKFNVVFSGAMDSNLVVEDTFDTSLFAPYKTGEYQLFGSTGTDGATEWPDTPIKAVTTTNTSTGMKLSATLTDSEFSTYHYFRITYYLKVKDAAAMKKIQDEIAKSGKDSISFTNHGQFGNAGNGTEFTYKYDYLNKELVNAGTLDALNRVAHYRITINPAGEMLNNGNNYDVTDEASSNLLINAGTLEFSDPSAVVSGGVSEDGHSINLVVKDGKALTITYDAIVIGTGEQTLTNHVKALGHEDHTEDHAEFKSGGGGIADLASIKVMKTEENNANVKLKDVKFDLYDSDGNKLKTYITDENGSFMIEGTDLTLYFYEKYTLKEQTPPPGYDKADHEWFFSFAENPDDIDPEIHLYPATGYTINVTNKPKTTSLILQKSITGDLDDSKLTPAQKKNIKFTITGTNYKFSKTVTYDQFTNGSYTVTGLRPDTYTIKETTSTITDYVLTSTLKLDAGETKNVKEGKIEVTLNDVQSEVKHTASFVNDYKKYSAKGEYSFNGTKELTGKNLTKDQFTFEVWDVTDTNNKKLVESVKNTADGKIPFSKLTYETDHIGFEKTYNYEVKEVKGSEPGVTYATTVYKFDIKVKDNGDGTLNVIPVGTMPTIKFVNTYGETGKIKFEGDKTLTGRELKAGEFTFQIKEGDKVVKTTTNDANGHFAFDEILYTEANIGTHNYTVSEVVPSTKLPGVTYDNKVYDVKVTVAKGSEGNLDVKADREVNNFTFTNDYAETGDVKFSGKKTLTGDTLTAGQFSFILTETTQGATYTETVQNNADGTFEFPNIHYTEANIGTHTYTIKEVIPSPKAAGMTYDEKVYDITVEVSKTGSGGKLTVKTNPTNLAAFNFGNVYEETGDVTVEGNKTLTGRELKAEEFSFTLSENGKVLETVKNDADGHFTFSKINYTLKDLGTHTYTVAEVRGTLPGVTYATNVETITVKVERGSNGKLKITKSENYNKLSFINTYEEKGDVAFNGVKELTDRDLKAGEYSFVLKEKMDDGTWKEIETTQNAADGSFAFKTINYGLANVGTHTYQISEVIPENKQSGIIYDETKYTFNVKVEKGEGGSLKVDKTEIPADINFKNEYKATGKTKFDGVKTLENRTLKDKEFTFILEEAITKDGKTSYKQLDKAQNDADGNFSFKEISYTQDDIGDHTYRITEEIPEEKESGVTYDESERIITVSVKASETETLDVKITSDNKGHVEFTNTYEATGKAVFKAHKVLEHRDLKDDEFTFTLSENGKVLQTKKNKANGDVIFDAINYTQAAEDLGVHTYTVAEVKESASGITYDETVYTFTVTVKTSESDELDIKVSEEANNMTFTNTYGASGQAVFKGQKVLENRDLEDGEFSFELYEEGNDEPIQTVTNDGRGDVVFEAIQYTQDDYGEHKYTIKEVVEDSDCVKYDETVKNVTVTVGPSETKDLDIQISEEGTNFTFTNTYEATGKASFKGHKVLEHRPLKVDEFEFTLSENGVVLQTVKNKANGEIPFEDITYTAKDRGTHTYTVKEVIPDVKASGITYDEATVYTVNVVVTPTDTKELDVQVDEVAAELNFTNTYSGTGYQPFHGMKVLDNYVIKADEFTFELYEEGTEEPLQTVKNKSDGTIEFTPIKYTEADYGDHIYTVKEVKGDEKGITYDGKVYSIKVNVAPGEDDKLIVTPSDEYDNPEELNFTNLYRDSKVTVEARKVYIGEPLKGGEFEFLLVGTSPNTKDVNEIASNEADGSIKFSTMVYTDAGVYTYILKEIVKHPGDDGFDPYLIYDDTEYRIKVEVTIDPDTHDVTAEYSVDGQYETPIFLNKKNVPNLESHIRLTAEKELKGADLKDKQFTFAIDATGSSKGAVPLIVNADGKFEEFKSVQVTNDANGQIAFPDIYFDTVGEFTFDLYEVKGQSPSYKYDDTVHKVVVTTDVNEFGRLVNTVKIDDFETDNLKVKFVNEKIKPEPVDASVEAKKQFDNGTLKAEMFEFALKGTSENTGKTEVIKKNAADGSVKFDKITYTEPGTYTYDLYEIKGDDELMTYDDTVYKVVVEVTENEETAKLEAVVKYDGKAEAPTFVNKLPKPAKVVVEAKKVFTGGTMKANLFEFGLKGTSDNTDKKEVIAKNDAKGVVAFPEMEYDEPGTYTYDLYEIKGKDATIKYDETVHKVVVEVTMDEKTRDLKAEVKYDEKDDTVTFTNKKTPSGGGGGGGGGVSTGDHTPVMALMLIMLLSAAVIAFIFFKKRKRA